MNVFGERSTIKDECATAISSFLLSGEGGYAPESTVQKLYTPN